MEVTLHSPTTLCLTFTYHPRIVERVKTIAGYTFDAKAKCWYVPLSQLHRCEALFPKASFDYACWQVEAEAMRQSAAQLFNLLARSGATFHVTEDEIVLVDGPCVSPVVENVVRDRSRWIAPLARQGATPKKWWLCKSDISGTR